MPCPDARLPAARVPSPVLCCDMCCAWHVAGACCSMDSLELKSLEEPAYLLREFVKQPVSCLTLATYLTPTVGETTMHGMTPCTRMQPAPCARMCVSRHMRACMAWPDLAWPDPARPWCACMLAGDIARKHIKDPELLNLIDIECFIFSTVRADFTPMVNAGLVFSDRCAPALRRGGVGMPATNSAARSVPPRTCSVV